jgi:hypothetical protein
MRWEIRQVAELTTEEQSALRTLSLAVYPPETATVWPGRAIEWAAHQWSVIGWGAEGVALCYVGIILREARWNERAVKVGGIAGVKTHPASRGRGFATATVRWPGRQETMLSNGGYRSVKQSRCLRRNGYRSSRSNPALASGWVCWRRRPWAMELGGYE